VALELLLCAVVVVAVDSLRRVVARRARRVALDGQVAVAEVDLANHLAGEQAGARHALVDDAARDARRAQNGDGAILVVAVDVVALHQLVALAQEVVVAAAVAVAR